MQLMRLQGLLDSVALEAGTNLQYSCFSLHISKHPIMQVHTTMRYEKGLLVYSPVLKPLLYILSAYRKAFFHGAVLGLSPETRVTQVELKKEFRVFSYSSVISGA